MSHSLGRYELLRPLASGGMAEVHLARRRGAAGAVKQLVIKRIRPERAGDSRFLKLFVAEARLSMALTHQNIVPVFDFGRSGDDLFLVMEHVAGLDLGRALAGRTMDPVLVAYVCAEACRALAYAHRLCDEAGRSLGVVHRDVTPKNLLLSRSGEVKLADFGVAALRGDRGVRGTPAYMAPEQARGEAVDGRSDLYALALVAREALTGRRDRRGADTEEVLMQARAGVLAPLGEDVPDALRAILERATSVAVSDRFPDAGAMARALDAFLVEARAAHRDLPPAERLASWLGAVAPEPEAAGEPRALVAVTFVDDGEDAVAGERTQRSLAETMAAPAPRRWWLGGAAVVGAIAALVVGQHAATPDPAAPPIVRPPADEVAQVAVPPPESEAPAEAREQTPDPTALAELNTEEPKVEEPKPEEPKLEEPKLEEPKPEEPKEIETPRPRTSRAGTPPPSRRVGGTLAQPSDSAPVETSAVHVNIVPWAHVTIDDDPTVLETPFTVRLAPGHHVLHLRNDVAKKTRDLSIEVSADDLKIVEQL